MQITDVESQPIQKNPHDVDVRKLYEKDHGQAVHIELKPGENLRKHVTPVDVFFYVLEGTATIEIGEETEEVDRNNLVESPAKISHRVMNNGESTVRFLVVKMPKPTESTKLL
ncbi:MAG: cupin domain-containing protein [Methanohalobium sp.]|uniref:cupin domain-containing protein n=1 Tax=Methanohalobium sp. TaxID=2837493 RepID=UPI00397E18C5